jgi:hypothetical protein
LRCRGPIRYNGCGFEVKAAFTLVRDLEPMSKGMTIRDDFHAIERAAGKAQPGAARMLCQVIGGLLLLITP